jgi:hypothetical protein
MMAVTFSKEQPTIALTPAAASGENERWPTLPPTAEMLGDQEMHDADAEHQVEQFGDYLIVHGMLPPAARYALLERYFEAGRGPCGGTVWWPREVRDV